MDASQIQNLIFIGADTVARIYPVAAPIIAMVEDIITKLEAVGIIPIEVKGASPEQLAAMAAGMAAARSSAVTEYKEQVKKIGGS